MPEDLTAQTFFPRLFSPIKVGRSAFKNRIVNTGHTLLMNDRTLSDTYYHYLLERARGGAACIIVESSPVHPSSTGMFDGGLELWKSAIIPRFRELSDAVHQYDARLLMLLWHSGHHGHNLRAGTPLLAPSAIPGSVPGQIPKELELEEIDEIVNYYGLSARNSIEAGLDGVEIQMADDYLLGSFLSPVLNRRDDEYGGSLDNRLRMVTRVIDAVRQDIGPGPIVGLRFSGNYFIPGTPDPENEVKEAARRLAATGKLDYLSVMAGSHYNDGLTSETVPSYYQPFAGRISYAAAIKEVTQLPVIGVGRIPDPKLAEEILDAGKADLIGIVRPLIADPEWPNKAQAGLLQDIRPCVYGNHCRSVLDFGLPGACTHNPAMGRESEWGIGTLVPAPRKKSVMVIGGGPAGMEAARVALLRGHAVTLYERGTELGGQVRYFKSVKRASEYLGVVTHLESQLRKLGCNIQMGVEVDERLVIASKADSVILATGAVAPETWVAAYSPDKAGLDNPDNVKILTSWKAFEPDAALGRNIVIIADSGLPESPLLVEYMIQLGKSVNVVTPEPIFGMSTLGPMGEMTLFNKRAARNNVEMTVLHVPVSVSAGAVHVRHVLTGVDRTIEADTIVHVTIRKANDKVYRALKGKVDELYRVGDCITPRLVHNAVVDGHAVGRRI
ncbi:MAG TPA: FAD-dependent oxidoreductase [Blastocatellia bacterium]